MDDLEKIVEFYKGKTVLITGHTGFKGSWLSKILIMAGAKVVGYSLEPPTKPNLFELLNLKSQMISIIGDVRDFIKLSSVFNTYQPEIIFHLAAQPIVRDSYKNPLYTFDVNVMGTVCVCECVRLSKSVKAFLNVTTDKVYDNNDLKNHPFKEEEKLDGYDPYSNSKSCSELVTHSYKRSFFDLTDIPVSTARAGNVIGGGDFANERIIPDAVRALQNHNDLIIRHPYSTRPYQHVFEPILCYLLINKEQFQSKDKSGSYNIGPDSCDCFSTKDLINAFYSFFPGAKYVVNDEGGPHESAYLSLDNGKIKRTFGWKPKLNINDALKMTADWYRCFLNSEDIVEISEKQINDYFGIRK